MSHALFFPTIDYLCLYCFCLVNVYEDLPCDLFLLSGSCVVSVVAGELGQWSAQQGVVVQM